MKKILLSLVLAFLGLASYSLTFMAFHEAWFPYYYEDYFTHIFLIGIVVLLLAPTVLAFIKKSSASDTLTAYLPNYYQAIVRVNLAVVLVCVLTFVYMTSNGTFIGGSGTSVFTIEPTK